MKGLGRIMEKGIKSSANYVLPKKFTTQIKVALYRIIDRNEVWIAGYILKLARWMAESRKSSFDRTSFWKKLFTHSWEIGNVLK